MEFPEIYQFPPFFTKQEHQETWMKQRDLWADLILQYCAHHRVFRLSLEETFTVESSRYETTTAGPAIVPGSTLFHNKALNRRLDPTVQREILDFMVLKKGQAQWRKEQGAASKTLPSVCYIYWKSLNEWADILYSWADNSGVIGTLLTVFEVLQGESNMLEPFYNMDMEVFDQVLMNLQGKGMVELFQDPESTASAHERGLRFLTEP